MSKKLFFGFLSIYAGWALFVMLSGAGANLLGMSWDFSTVGHLGDAFGVLNAGMATLAAGFTLATLLDERAANKLLRDEQAQRDTEARELRAEERELVRKRDVEARFFRLLESRRDVVRDVNYGGSKNGLDAFREMEKDLTVDAVKFGRGKASCDLFDNTSNNLHHYFRLTYHIVRYADDRLSFEEAYDLVRMLRAQLSESEQFLIALNASYGQGRPKMLRLINKYSILHNLSKYKKDYLEDIPGIKRSAFVSASEDGEQ